MADTRASAGLQTIFAVFLGLMLTAFVGVGVYTFYPPPDLQSRDQITRLTRDEQAIRNAKPEGALTAEDRARIQQSVEERNRLQDAGRKASEGWGRRTSIILVVFATLAMAVSLIRAAELPVISNGLLLGGVFTMLYGVGWIIASDTSAARFAVMTGAFAITLGLGYVRFVRQRTAALASASETTLPTASVPDLERRVQQLEQRIEDAANALGRRSQP